MATDTYLPEANFSLTCGQNNLAFGNYDPQFWCPTVQQYFPVYYPCWYESPNKLEQAFRVVSVLVEEKVVTVKTIKHFIELVEKVRSKL